MTDWTPWTTGPQADRWAALFRQALARGGHPALTHEDERLLRPLALMTLATERLPALALVLPVLQLTDDIDEAAPITVRAQRLAAAVVRFTVRALEVHARDVGYRPGECDGRPARGRRPLARGRDRRHRGRPDGGARAPRRRARRRPRAVRQHHRRRELVMATPLALAAACLH